MVSGMMLKLLNIMPSSFIGWCSKKIVDRLLNKYARIDVEGKDNLMGIKTPTLFICNHLSNSDGLVLNKVLKAIDPTFVAGVKLSDNSVTSIGMNVVKTTAIKPNSVDTQGLKNIIKLVEEGESILIFPEGTRSRVGSLVEARKGILLILKKTGIPIIPIGLSGTEKLLPINSNGDMATEKFDYAEVKVNIGQAFNLPEKEEGMDRRTYSNFQLDYIMDKIAVLLPENYRGYYK